MKDVNSMAVLLEAIHTIGYAADAQPYNTKIGKSNMKRKRRELCSIRTRPHSRRNKLGSHKQIMRKLGKLK